MFPLYDENRPNKISIITIGLIFFNALIFFLTIENLSFAIHRFGMVPQSILSGKYLYTVLTSIFIHASFLHLLGNMWFLWVFGNNLESAMGRFRYFIFYILCGVFASIFYAVLATPKTILVVGASGAISGILGGYFILFPGHKIKSFFIFFFLSVPAIVFLVIWVLYQVFFPEAGVAAGAHLIGFLAGILLVNPLKKGKMKKSGIAKKSSKKKK